MKDQNKKTNKTKTELLAEISELKSRIKLLEENLYKTESANEYDTIAATVLDGLFVLSKSGFQSVNETLAKMLGYTPQELLKLQLKDLVASSHRDMVIERAQLRLAGKDLPRSYDVNLLSKNGEKIVPVTLNVGLLKTKKENVIVGIVKDNSEKTKVKKELEDLQNKFNAITNSAADGIVIISAEYTITYWNKSAEKIFGYKFREALGKDLIGLIFPAHNRTEIINKLTESKLKIQPDKTSTVYETTVTNINGKSIPVEISISIVQSEDEHDLILIIRDISERKEKDQQLTRERNLTQYFMDYIPFSIYFKDLESRFIKVNKATLDKLGFSSFEQIIGRTDHDIFTKDHADEARADELKLIRAEEIIINKIEKETWQDGSISWVNTTKVPLKDEAGKIIGTLGITTDFTQIKKSELIQQTLLKISTAVNTVEEMDDLYSEIHQAVQTLMKADNFYIALYDEKTRILSFPYFVDQFDPKPSSRIAGRGLTEYILRSGKAHLIDAELDMALRKLGETNLLGEPAQIWLGVPLKIGDKTIGAVVVQDYDDPNTYGQEELRILTYVSEQIANAIMKKNSEYELKSYSEELQELNASKDKFFSIIAHDLKSPFQGLMGLSRLIVEDYDELSEDEKRSFILALNESAESTYKLIENLLEWSRLQTGRMKYNPSKIDLFEIVESIKMLLFQTAELKNIKIKNKIPQGTHVWGDKYMLTSLFQNLISNSIKFTNRFGEIIINSSIDNNFIEVSVEDNGVGIEPEDIDKLFKIDSTFSTRGTEQEKGTGLGLMLCKEIIMKHDGDMKIESEKGRGTRVLFTLNSKNINSK